jgi:hypothetical protein
LEAESESHVNHFARELSALQLAQQLASQQNSTSPGLSGASANGDGTQSSNLPRLPNPIAPNSEDMLEAMRRENKQLRNRLVDTEREYIRISRPAQRNLQGRAHPAQTVGMCFILTSSPLLLFVA